MSTRCSRAAVLAALAIAAVPAVSQAQGTTYSAEVRRTSFGIAHVKAADYGSIGYGVGYAFSQDNFCMIADEFVTVRGERSRHFGETGTTPYGRNNLVSDYYYTLFNGDPAALRAGLASMSPELQAAFRGWAAGYNRYLRDTGVANLPAPCTGAAWVRPIDEVDMMRLVRRYLLEASFNQFMEGMVAAKPPAAAAAASPDPSKSGSLLGPKSDAGIPGFDQEYWRTYRSDLGSNALAIGSEGTDNGRGLLLGNPHFPWSGTLRFYQFHVTIPDEIDVMGGALSGFPLILIGFNKDVAWSHTNDTPNFHFTLYQLKLDPSSPTKYVYDGQARDMTSKTVSVQVRNADGTLSTRSNTFWFSHFGPIMTSTALPIPWTRTSAYAIRDTNLDNWRIGDQWRAINKSKSTGEIKQALQSIVGNPWVNTTATDKDGNAFYGDISTTPNLPREKQSLCTPDATFAVVFASGGPPVLDGSRSSCEWDDGGGPQPGLMPADNAPFLERRDFVQNSNDSYWLANPAVEMYRWSIPASMGLVPGQQNMRTRLGITQARARLAGTDGLAGNKFSLANLQQIALSNRSYTADLFMADVAALCALPVASAVQAECGVLSAWDRKYDLTSRGAHLFREFFNTARGIANVYKVPFNYLDPVNTPSGFNVADATVATALAGALKGAGDRIRGAGLAIDAPLGAVQFTLRGSTPIPLHGGEGDYLGIYNKISTTLVPGLGYVVTTGTSYIQTVHFTDSGPNAQAFLTYSQSTNPASPNFSDQTIRFSAKQWITLPFTEAAITADPAYRTTTIRE